MKPKMAMNFDGIVILVKVINSLKVLLETIAGRSKIINGHVTNPINDLSAPPNLAHIGLPVGLTPRKNSLKVTPISKLERNLSRIKTVSRGRKSNVLVKKL